MDFNAKRLALLAGVGNHEDRHEIVQEQVQQLNETVEARQVNKDEADVRKAVRRTIQKMISEGAINLKEDSIKRELEHLRANIKADHDHLEALVHDMHDDRDEIERAEHHREEMHDSRMEEASDDALNEADAALRRLQALAGVQILTEGYTDDELRELCHSKDHNCALVVEHPEWGRGKPIHGSHALPDDEGNVEWYDVQFKHGIERKVMAEDVEVLKMGHHMGEDEMDEDEDHMEEGEMVDGAKTAPPAYNQNVGQRANEEEAEEGMIYELEDGTLEMRIGEKRYVMQELEEDLDEELVTKVVDTETGKEYLPSK